MRLARGGASGGWLLGKVKAKNIPKGEGRGGALGWWTLPSSAPACRGTEGPLVRNDRIPRLHSALRWPRTPTNATDPVSQLHERALGDLQCSGLMFMATNAMSLRNRYPVPTGSLTLPESHSSKVTALGLNPAVWCQY